MHGILDHYSTHKPRDDRWLRMHPNVHFHFTPTHASWLNQVEIWFSMLWRHALRGASFTSPTELRRAIDRYVAAYSEWAHPFEWTKSVVYPARLKRKYSDLCKEALANLAKTEEVTDMARTYFLIDHGVPSLLFGDFGR